MPVSASSQRPTPLAKVPTVNKNVAVSVNTTTNQKLENFIEISNEIKADPQKYIPNIQTTNIVPTPAFNYGPNGGPGMGAIIAAGGVLQKGDIGYCVQELQKDLNESLSGPITVDGNFGAATQQSVEYFQSAYNRAGFGDLSVDGIVGSATQTALKNIVTQLGQTFYD